MTSQTTKSIKSFFFNKYIDVTACGCRSGSWPSFAWNGAERKHHPPVPYALTSPGHPSGSLPLNWSQVTNERWLIQDPGDVVLLRQLSPSGCHGHRCRHGDRRYEVTGVWVRVWWVLLVIHPGCKHPFSLLSSVIPLVLLERFC